MINEGRDDPAMVEAVQELLKFPVVRRRSKPLVALSYRRRWLAPGTRATAGVCRIPISAALTSIFDRLFVAAAA